MKVEELEMYGKALEMPKEALKKQMKVVFSLLKKEFGIFGEYFGQSVHCIRSNVYNSFGDRFVI